MVAVHGDRCCNGNGGAARSLLTVNSVEALCHKFCERRFAYNEREQGEGAAEEYEQIGKIEQAKSM